MATSGGEGGGIQGITAADSTIIISGTQTAPTVKAHTGTTAGTVAAGDDARFGKIGGVTVTGTPTAGQIPIASSGSAAAWGTPSGGGGAITSGDITDATTVGKAVLTAANTAAARSAIGAGTSNLVLGSTSGTAMPGNTTAAEIGGQPAGSYATAAQGALAEAAAPLSITVVQVNHGADPDMPRPAGVGGVRWIGTVAPNNAILGDTGYGW